MGGGVGKKKRVVKVASFIPSWLDKAIDGCKVSVWLKPDPENKGKAVCTLCPAPNSISVNEGWKAINQHSDTKKHQDNLKASQTNPEFRQVDHSAPKITDGLKKMHDLSKQQNAKKEAVLVSQVHYTAAMMYHGAGRLAVDCQAELMPHLFPDSMVAKVYDIRRTKLGYFATHGLYPYFHDKLVKNLQDRPYSLNFDESTVNGESQLDINVSYLTTELLVEKRCLTTVALQGGTTGKELALQVINELKSRNIDPLKMMAVSTDGCSAMIGVLNGAQKVMRDIIPTLPIWGGCADHDLANLIKSSVAKLCPNLTSIFSALHGCLNKHSMHKKRKFEGMSEWIGIEIRKVPKFLSVRFRVIEACCKWLASQDRGVYKYFSEMKQELMAGQYEPSDTEMIVLEKYLGSYLEVKLSNLFILDVCKPVMELISFFEAEKVRIQDRHKKLVMLFKDYLGKFMKNGGLEDENNNLNGEEVLNLKINQRDKQLEDDDIYLGPKVEALLLEMGLSRKSEELKFWLLQVRGFYEEALYKMKKYFSSSIRSKTLQALSVLSPKSWTTVNLDTLKQKWRVLGEAFPNILEMAEVPALLSEVTVLKGEGGLVNSDQMTVDGFFSSLSKEADDDGNFSYPLLTRLGSALSTIYNSSSPAERDFSLMNLIVGDPRKNRTSQLLLLAKMFITAEIRSLARNCKRCKTLSLRGEQSPHCHCSLWHPPEDLLVTMRNGQPYQRYRRELDENRVEEESLKGLKEMQAADDALARCDDLAIELKRLQKRVKKKEVASLEEAKKKEAEAEKKKKEAKEKKGKKKEAAPKRKKEVSAAEKKRQDKRRRLADD